MKIRDVLKMKNRPVVTIDPDDAVISAIQKLCEYDRGCLPVCDKNGELVGIITERDIVRKYMMQEHYGSSATVSDYMTQKVAIGLPEDNLEYAISVMKQKRIRHLPIIETGRVVGIISMRDLLDTQLEETRAQIRYIAMLPRRSARLPF